MTAEKADSRVSFQWAFELISSLYNEGIRELWISPGSRSTPLVLAAEVHSGFRTHVVLDERSSGFAALGIGKCSSRPAVLICTSGTAALNYGPAIQEAANSGTPLVVLTADRPASLRQTGSSQTIDQIKLFGDRVLFFHECGTPSFDTVSVRRLRLAGVQAVREAVEQRGVSHLNISFTKPFEPTSAQWEAAAEKAKQQILKGYSAHKPINTVSSRSFPEFGFGAKRPLLIAGPMNLSDPLFEGGSAIYHQITTPKGQRIPLLSDPGSPIPTDESGPIGHLLSYLSHQTDHISKVSSRLIRDLKPDLIVRLGDTPYSPSLSRLLELWAEVPHLLITSRFTWQDPVSSSPSRWVTQSSESVLNFLRELSKGTDSEWISTWNSLDNQARKAIQSVELHTESFTDYTAIEGLLGRIPPEYSVFLSNSMIPRDVAILQSRIGSQQFLVNRGAAGIDGITSTAVGCAAALKKPLALLTGDLAFLHDVGALALQSHLETPLLIGVIQNRGGTIFRKLPVFSTIEKERFRHYFETPQEVDLESLCKAYQVSYRRITQAQELSSLTLLDSPGIHVIELVTDPDASHDQRTEFLDSAFRRFLDPVDSHVGISQYLDSDARQGLYPGEVTTRDSENGEGT